MAEESCLSDTLEILSKLSGNLENFLEVHEENADSLKLATKGLYDFTYNQLPVKNGLSELVVKHFDNEQIWQELELYNTGVTGELIKDLSHLLAGKDQISFKTATTAENNQTEDDLAEEDEDEGVEEVEDEEEESDEELKKIKSRLKAFDKIANKNQIASDLDSDSDGDPDDLAKEFHEENNVEEEEEKNVEEEEEELEEKVQTKKDKKKKKSAKPTIVDDTFFKLSEMDTFLKQQDALEMKKSKDQLESDEEDEDIDIFQDIGSDTEENIDELKFKDFFRGPEDELPLKRVRFSDDIGDDGNNQSHSGDDDDDDDDDGPPSKTSKLFDSEEESEGEEVSDIIGGELDENKSSFELRQQRLQKKISQLEKASVADKSWQLSGEIGAGARPENSLLEEHVQFDSTLKLAPEITEETTKTVEDIIIQRIKDQAWDDVERKIKTADAPYEYKKPTILDQEKSKQSLGDIYEKEYQKQQETQEETEDKNDPEHEEIKKMMNSLFMKLDALSNFHFTPKVPIPDVKIVANLPSITMEEVAPVGISENQLAAPKELLDPLRNSLKGKTERSISDRNKERKLKKKLKKLQWKEKEKKQKRLEMIDPDSLKTSKNRALRKLEKQSRSGKKVTVIKTNSKKGKKSSADFFNQLQNEVTHEIGKKKQTKKKTNAISSVQLKL